MCDIVDSYCGLSCAECSYRESNGCKGCIATEGKPFHGDECEVAECAISNGKRFCGECADFPCEILKRYSFDEEHGDNGDRIKRCAMLKRKLVKDARDGLYPVGYCGLHCDCCFMTEWCGGCRSEYNCCSYATICDDGVCPNAECALEKGLKGCWDCGELEDCRKGYYSKDDEFAAKAAALFIKKYGDEAYSEAIRKTAQNPEFENAASVVEAIKALEHSMES